MRIILALTLIFVATVRGEGVPATKDVQILTQPKQVAIIKENGDIEVKMEPTKAAREFWKLVREDAQQCKCTCPGDKK